MILRSVLPSSSSPSSSPSAAVFLHKRCFFFMSDALCSSSSSAAADGGRTGGYRCTRRNTINNNYLPTRLHVSHPRRWKSDNASNSTAAATVSLFNKSKIPLTQYHLSSTCTTQYSPYASYQSCSSSFIVSKQSSVNFAMIISDSLRRRGFASNSININSNNTHCTSSTTLSTSNNINATTSSSISYSSISNSAPTTINSNAATKYFTTTINPDLPQPSIESQLSQLRAEIANLSYLMKQSASQQLETQSLSRRAEARAYIIENKLMDIQSHVVKIPALENLATNLRQFMKTYSVSDAFRSMNTKYVVWVLLGSTVLFWQYRNHMYERTSEEVANVAALTLQQDSLRKTIQETLTTVANSPETLASLSALFQKLISEERTEQHLINLIVRALNSEGVRDAAIRLLDVCFRNPDLMKQAGEFLKVAANATVLDEGVQRSAGVGIQQALKSAVLPWWAKNIGDSSSSSGGGGGRSISNKSNNGKDTRIIAESVGGNDHNNHVAVDAQQEPDDARTDSVDQSVVSDRRNPNGSKEAVSGVPQEAIPQHVIEGEPRVQ
ncbi:hypothetical protein ACHAWU_008797 [Discostella pseudostelligera]|uniref:Uncharacterized protein n=1 Tax=Discostella pseudostelligera TaxID=259834 RepID=A0ABD3N262_9STRA